jgi:hypothetical protein
VWWTDLRGKGTRNSPNGAPYSGGSPGRRKPAVEARTGGQGGRRLGRGAAWNGTRARGWVSWAGKRAEGAGTGEVLDGRPGSGGELGGAEVMEVKRGKLESDVHPLWPRKAVDGGGASCGWSSGAGEAMGHGKMAAPLFGPGR